MMQFWAPHCWEQDLGVVAPFLPGAWEGNQLCGGTSTAASHPPTPQAWEGTGSTICIYFFPGLTERVRE